MQALRPSKAHRWTQCPGSTQLEVIAPERDEGAAEEGTAAHWLATQMLAGISVPAGSTAPNGVLIDQEMLYHIQGYVEYLHHNFPREAGWVWRVEEKIPIPLINWEGTPDFFATNCHMDAVACVDLKYGFRPVRAERNWQLLCYLSTVLAKHYYAVIYQPRGPGDAADLWYFDGAGGTLLTCELEDAARRARDPLAPLITGGWCANCSGRLRCPAIRDLGLTALEVAHENSPVTLDDAQLASELRFIRWAEERLKIRLEALEQEALSRLQQGADVPGYYLGRGRGRKEWAVSAEELVLLGQGFNVPLLKAPAPITPVQAIQAGIPKEVVNAFSTYTSGKPIICEGDNSAFVRKVFGE